MTGWAQPKIRDISLKCYIYIYMYSGSCSGIGCSEHFVVSVCGDFQNMTGHGAEQPSVGDPVVLGFCLKESPEVSANLSYSM